MVLGVLKDIKIGENRVILTPGEVATVIKSNHVVLVEKDAGLKAGFSDEKYIEVGAKICDKLYIYANADLIAKVKELDESEFNLLRENQIVFTCLHPAGNRKEVDVLLQKKIIGFAAEDTHRYGSPNCEAAGKVGALMGLYSIMSNNGGKGKFVSGFGGAPSMNVLILGCGTVGRGAIDVMYSLGANVTVAATNIGHLREINYAYNGKISTIISNNYNIDKELKNTDILINCVRWDKSNKNPLITRDMVRSMEKGSVIVDISNDYGAIETFHETSIDNPIYIEEGIVHYCVSNIPSLVANSTSVAYAASIRNHIINILNYGVKEACVKDGYLRRGLVTCGGYLTHEETSQIQNRKWITPEKLLNIEDRELDMAPKNTAAVSDLYYDEEELGYVHI